MKLPEKGFYYHYKHDSNLDVNNYSYEVIGVANEKMKQFLKPFLSRRKKTKNF